MRAHYSSTTKLTLCITTSPFLLELAAKFIGIPPLQVHLGKLLWISFTTADLDRSVALSLDTPRPLRLCRKIYDFDGARDELRLQTMAVEEHALSGIATRLHTELVFRRQLLFASFHDLYVDGLLA